MTWRKQPQTPLRTAEPLVHALCGLLPEEKQRGEGVAVIKWNRQTIFCACSFKVPYTLSTARAISACPALYYRTMLYNETCENTTVIHADGNPVVSTLMFLAGVLGNLTALAILGVHQKDRRAKSSVFCILVTGLAVTDLLGTCFLSPLVFVCYARRASLLGLTGDQRLCSLFAFAMTFFGLASILILCAMAVERCLAISHPYFYAKYVRRSFAKAALLLIYLFTCAFCSLPFLGLGRHKQYCPGTWCFIKMEAKDEGAEEERRVLAFSLAYASLMALLIAAVFLCNGSVIVSLCRMHQSQLSRRGSMLSSGRKRKMSLWIGQGEEEVDHLVLLASMTIIFVICSLPLTGFQKQ
ncbi:hypothetical protein SKAU_G00216810 [Synaphobranchus kaupii]|uniref:G-protein coupled receptors family 1 profile domain-containing protein n=1 Tax=Synaphobranchus kaupii TaxID=118154 RepID=A0A9Q1F9V6_SYNKA|nr:hypothetical protein SKAU_G00216810 [Synaphobranchus kaupii]